VLELRLIGDLEVVRDGTPLALPPSKRTRALLGYIAATGRRHRRDQLISMFWELPDDPRGALRWSLSKLRPLVDDPDQARIVADRDSVAFEPGGAQVDLTELREAVGKGLDSRPTDELIALAETIRGEFLAGIDLSGCDDFAAWLVAQREDVRALRAKLLAALVARLSDEPEAALPYARALVEADPGNAAGRAELVQLLGATGRMNEAEQQYKSGSRYLDELGGEGTEELRRAWLGIRGEAVGVPRAAIAPVTEIERVAEEGGPYDDPVLARAAIAVLPFTNMSGNPEQDYFTDGITDDLIVALSHWRTFPVISRFSTFAFKDRALDVVSIGRELGARYVVQGSVRRAGERVRITVQLVDAGTGHHIWAQRYDRELGDVFALQDEITQAVVIQIEPTLQKLEMRRAESLLPQNLDAWDLNQRALAQIHRGGPKDFVEAKRLLDESLRLDPVWSRTYSLRALAGYHQILLDWTADPKGSAASYIDDAMKAVELEDGNWLAHALCGIALLWGRKAYEAAAEEENRAIALNPSSALAHQFQGCVLSFAGCCEEAMGHLRAARRLNPHREPATLLLADVALCHYLLGRFEEAASFARQALQEFPGNLRAHQRLVAALGQLGRREEAEAELKALMQRQRRLSGSYVDATYPFQREEHRDVFREGLVKAGWRPDA
jgi:TolB-like protein/DNA-binding SARP family transcriptional activator